MRFIRHKPRGKSMRTSPLPHSGRELGRRKAFLRARPRMKSFVRLRTDHLTRCAVRGRPTQYGRGSWAVHGTKQKSAKLCWMSVSDPELTSRSSFARPISAGSFIADKPFVFGLAGIPPVFLSALSLRRTLSALLGQFSDELLKFSLRPSTGGTRAHVALRTERQREFGDVVPIGRIEDDNEVAVTGREIDLLDLNAHFLGKIACGLSALGGLLDRTDSLVGPIERQYERWHAVLPDTTDLASERLASVRTRGRFRLTFRCRDQVTGLSGVRG